MPGFCLDRHTTYIVATHMAISVINHRLDHSRISDFDRASQRLDELDRELPALAHKRGVFPL